MGVNEKMAAFDRAMGWAHDHHSEATVRQVIEASKEIEDYLFEDGEEHVHDHHDHLDELDEIEGETMTADDEANFHPLWAVGDMITEVWDPAPGEKAQTFVYRREAHDVWFVYGKEGVNPSWRGRDEGMDELLSQTGVGAVQRHVLIQNGARA